MPAKKRKSSGRGFNKGILLSSLFGFIAVIVLLYSVSFLPQVTSSQAKKQTATRDCDMFQSCSEDLVGKSSDNSDIANVDGQSFTIPTYQPTNSVQPRVLGASTLNKHMVVDLTTQTLYAYEGSQLANQFTISSGKWHVTPTGHFTTWIKLFVTRMVGGDKAIGTYYNLPNIHYVMYFYNSQYPKSYGLSTHEAYWHNNFGHPMSHGCINMRLADAEWLYNWADPPTVGYVTKVTTENPGTPIDIIGVTPKS